MARVLFAVFLLLHGAIHALWFVPAPDDPKWPFRLDRSPLLPSVGSRALRRIAGVLITLTMFAFALSALVLFGIPVLAQVWGITAIAGSVLSIATCAVFWDRQLATGPVIDLAIIAAVLVAWPVAI